MEGRVEVYLKNQWGTVGARGDLKGVAQTVCRQMGYYLNLDSNDGSTPYGTVGQLGFVATSRQSYISWQI